MMNTKVVLLLSLFVVYCLASCSHSCRNHGDCVNNACVCYTGWTGDDCSIVYQEIQNNQTISASVNGDWAYYYTNVVNNPVEMNFTINDGSLSDCDIYIRKGGEFPTKRHYDYSDSSLSNNVLIRIPTPDNGIWIVGIYNYFECSFSLTLKIKESAVCPNNCSGHGTCSVNSTCICNDNYGGEDCSVAYVSLTDGVAVQNHVAKFQWQMYYFDSTSLDGTLVPDFTVIVNQTANQGDSDLYIQYETIPTLWVYEYRNALVVDNYFLTVSSPQVGRYYLGVYGFNPCDYTIQVQVAHSVEVSCSDHGYAVDNVCQCTGSFAGEHCEYMTTDLVEGQSVEGYTGANMWNFYTVTAGSSNNMVITLQQDWNVDGDCDLYIRAGSNPDRFHYDYRDIGFDRTFSVVVENPLDTPWHIGVFGYRACRYFITETIVQSSCPNDCSGHGTCNNGRCACSSGFAGSDCNSTLSRIESAVPVTGAVHSNKWQYYKFTAPSAHSSITVQLAEDDTIGYLNIFVTRGAPPSLLDYDYQDIEVSRYHNIYFRYDGTVGDEEFYIGVYGTAYITGLTTASYHLLVYSPPI